MLQIITRYRFLLLIHSYFKQFYGYYVCVSYAFASVLHENTQTDHDEAFRLVGDFTLGYFSDYYYLWSMANMKKTGNLLQLFSHLVENFINVWLLVSRVVQKKEEKIT